MKRAVILALGAAVVLSGCAPSAREPDNLALVRVLGVDGVWLAVPVAELLSFGVSLWFFRWGGKRYGYAG